MKYDLNNFIFFIDRYCEILPACPGKCRSQCLPGEVASSSSVEIDGCRSISVSNCCRRRGELASTDIVSASSSTNLPNHLAWKAFDGSLFTKWMPKPNAALPQWVKVIMIFHVVSVN